MNYIIAIIHSYKLEDVRDALIGVGIEALTVAEVRRYGAHAEHIEIYRGTDYKVGFMPHTKIEFVASDEELEALLGTLREAVYSEDLGEEGIVVVPCRWQIL
jgi:nitrogen regulatory protein PII